MNLNTRINVSDKITKLILKIIYFTVLVSGIYLAYISFAQGKLLVFIFGVLPCGSILGIISVKLWLPKFGEWVGFGFLFPRTFLGKAPLSLSPYWGMLIHEDYAGMLAGLQPLIPENPGHPDLIYLYTQACMNIPGMEKEGFDVMEQHFSLSDREHSENHIKLLFYYADKSAEYQKYDFLESILQQELGREYYTDSEKKMIETRLNSIRSM